MMTSIFERQQDNLIMKLPMTNDLVRGENSLIQIIHLVFLKLFRIICQNIIKIKLIKEELFIIIINFINLF